MQKNTGFTKKDIIYTSFSGKWALRQLNSGKYNALVGQANKIPHVSGKMMKTIKMVDIPLLKEIKYNKEWNQLWSALQKFRTFAHQTLVPAKNGLQAFLWRVILTWLHCWSLVHLKELTTATDVTKILTSGQITKCGGLLGSLSLASSSDIGFSCLHGLLHKAVRWRERSGVLELLSGVEQFLIFLGTCWRLVGGLLGMWFYRVLVRCWSFWRRVNPLVWMLKDSGRCMLSNQMARR